MPGKVVGILGGMGPEATISLFEKIVSLTPADCDQDHLRIIVNNDPGITDRTDAIINANRSIVDELVNAAAVLERAGADFIVMPCNTAHHYYAELASAVNLPFINMIEEVAGRVQETLPACMQVGLLATTGTHISGVYQEVLQANGIAISALADELQTGVMQSVMRIKSTDQDEKNLARETLLQAGSTLVEAGAGGLVLGCTEIALVIGGEDFSVPVFDSLQILAEATLEYAMDFGVHG